jgi:hypothetical protein
MERGNEGIRVKYEYGQDSGHKNFDELKHKCQCKCQWYKYLQGGQICLIEK